MHPELHAKAIKKEVVQINRLIGAKCILGSCPFFSKIGHGEIY
jgi:hypothetical protein